MQGLAKKAGCFYCRKVGHQAKDYPLKKPQITRAAGTIQQGSQPPPSTTHNEIASAAQSYNICESFSSTPKTKGASAVPVLDSSAEHLLVTTKIADNIAKTQVDQQTVAADVIRSK